MFRFAPQNQIIGRITTDLFLDMYIPRILHPVGRPLLYAALDESVLDALGYRRPPRALRKMIDGGMRSHAWLLRYLPERRKASRGTERKRETYPHGYVIEEIGTFPSASHTE